MAIAGLDPILGAILGTEPTPPGRRRRAVHRSSLTVATDQAEAPPWQRREGFGVVVATHARRLPAVGDSIGDSPRRTSGFNLLLAVEPRRPCRLREDRRKRLPGWPFVLALFRKHLPLALARLGPVD